MEELLIRYGKLAKEKIDKARCIKQIEEIQSCSFKPMINNTNDKIALEKLGSGKRFDKLFDDYKTKMSRHEDLVKMVQ